MNQQDDNSNANGRTVSDAEESSPPNRPEQEVAADKVAAVNDGNESNNETKPPEAQSSARGQPDTESDRVIESLPRYGPTQASPPPPHPQFPAPNHYPPGPMAPFPPPPLPPSHYPPPPGYYYGPGPFPPDPNNLSDYRMRETLAWAHMATMYANIAHAASQQAAASYAAMGGNMATTPNNTTAAVEDAAARYWSEPSPKPSAAAPWNDPVQPNQSDHRHKKRGSRPEDDQRRNPPTRRRARWQSSDSSSSGGSWRRPPVKKKAISLLGKTGVSALFEWSSKRHITPTLTVQNDREKEYFECIVYLPASKADKEVLQEWGRGRGRSKAVAKQEAARNAISALLPGVKFDCNTGVITVLPQPHPTNYTEDELPNLTRRLALDRGTSTYENKRARDTTTSEEDSESAHLVREGAGVCSQLLHTMIQINPERLPTAPVFMYDTPSSRGFPFKCTGHLETRDDLLSAVGMGGTKREARHAVSARLLALLFPHCSNMTAVKEAAEAKREEYAKGRTLKQAARAAQATKRAAPDRKPTDDDSSDDPSHSSPESKSSYKHDESSPRSPQDESVEEDLVSSVSAVALNEGPPETKQPKRRKCSDEFDQALLVLNNNKAVPDEYEDVGRTILRRAEPVDLPRILKLFADNSASAQMASPPPADDSETGRPLHVVLLLCRAIAAYEDPPLGCAILSKEADDRLRLVQLATEHHLPDERFLECLGDFATCMKCTLEPKNTDHLLDPSEIGKIVGIVGRQQHEYVNGRSTARKIQLQSVLEGSEEESAEEARPKKRGEVSSKVPSKRSRVQ